MSTRRLWSRILRNAAALARLRVLECLHQGTCRDVIGTGAGGDLTKRFDVVAEEAMVTYLKRFASFTLMSEEAGTKQIGASPKGFVIMDPIDGSTNVSHNIAFACIAIAFATELKFDRIETAVVLDLFSGTSYHASRGRGAYRDMYSIYPAKNTRSETSLVGVDSDFPTKSLRRFSEKTDKETIRFTRHFGANALELCYVADGSLDGFIDLRGVFRGTDLAAAMLILQEAGAAVISEKGFTVRGQCTNEARYAYIAARDEQFARTLLALAKEK
jgi:myo-inositol-1(or 4)-monophosphatase